MPEGGRADLARADGCEAILYLVTGHCAIPHKLENLVMLTKISADASPLISD